MSDTSYDDALNALQAYLEHIHDYVKREKEALEAVPGYQTTLDAALKEAHTSRQAHKSPQENFVSVPFSPEVLAVYAEFEKEHPAQEAERFSVVALCAQLDEADIRRMIDALSLDGSHTVYSLFRMLACSRNPAAVEPLVERLAAPVLHREPPHKESRFSRWVWEHLPDSWTQQRSYRAISCRLDRTSTLRTLGCLGGERAEAAIRPFLTDEDEEIRKAAQQALVLIETQSA